MKYIFEPSLLLGKACGLACDMVLTNKRRNENTDKSHRITEKKIALVFMFIYAKYGGELIRIDKPIF
jgi:hypothetical protein